MYCEVEYPKLLVCAGATVFRKGLATRRAPGQATDCPASPAAANAHNSVNTNIYEQYIMLLLSYTVIRTPF